MGILSDGQFTSAANDKGVSRFLSSGEQVKDTDPANRGKYAVSYPGTMGHEDDPLHPVLRDRVAAHREAMLADPTLSANPRTMQGGWPAEGKVYLDASRMVDGRRTAAQLGQEGKQLAVRDMSKGRDVHMKRGAAWEAARKQGPEFQAIGAKSRGFTVEPRRKS